MSLISPIDSPIPLSEIESVLTWVDTFNLSRPTKKINRDFSDGVLLAEILNVHYPKLVEKHNYPPRNSHSLKLNNWMTLNRKVLKKLKLNLCLNTMEQLSNSAPGVIERVLVMVRDKIRSDEEANRASKDEGTNVSSGGSYYEAIGDDEHILVVPVKMRVNGVLETLQQKVVSYEAYCALKEELKDACAATEVLKQKVEHLDSLLKLKEERISELQNQLERKQARRKEVEALQNNLSVPFDNSYIANDGIHSPSRSSSLKSLDNKSRTDDSKIKIEEIKMRDDELNLRESKTKLDESLRVNASKTQIDEILRPAVSKTKVEEIHFRNADSKTEFNTRPSESKTRTEEYTFKAVDSKSRVDEPNLRTIDSKTRIEESRIPVLKVGSRPSLNDIHLDKNLHMKYDVFKDPEIVTERCDSNTDHEEEFKDSEQGDIITIEDTVQNEINIISQKQGVYNVHDYVVN